MNKDMDLEMSITGQFYWVIYIKNKIYASFLSSAEMPYIRIISNDQQGANSLVA